MALVHEDTELLERALDNPVMRWMAGVFGRLDQSAWETEGIEPPLPRDWHYAVKLLPVTWTDSEIEDFSAERRMRWLKSRSFTDHRNPLPRKSSNTSMPAPPGSVSATSCHYSWNQRMHRQGSRATSTSVTASRRARRCQRVASCQDAREGWSRGIEVRSCGITSIHFSPQTARTIKIAQVVRHQMVKIATSSLAALRSSMNDQPTQ